MPTATTLFVIIGVIIVLLIILGVIYYFYSKKQFSTNIPATPQTIVTSPNSVSVISTPSAPLPQSLYPAGLTEGEVIRCATTGSIYQLVNGMKQWYPSPAVYAAYGSPYATNVDCNTIASIPSGPDFSVSVSQAAAVNTQVNTGNVVTNPDGTAIPVAALTGQNLAAAQAGAAPLATPSSTFPTPPAGAFTTVTVAGHNFDWYPNQSLVGNIVTSPGTTNSHGKYYGTTNNESSCQTMCANDQFCMAYTWYDSFGGQYANQCFGADSTYTISSGQDLYSGAKIS